VPVVTARVPDVPDGTEVVQLVRLDSKPVLPKDDNCAFAAGQIASARKMSNPRMRFLRIWMMYFERQSLPAGAGKTARN
jgi:hypothetical protein